MLIVDRIEGGFAVCEGADRAMTDIPLTELPTGVREGDCLRALPEGGYAVDPEETARRRARNRELLEGLWGE